jgi:phospholipase C
VVVAKPSLPSRRQVLAGAAAASAGAALSSPMGRLVERAYAAEPTKCAPLSDIEHVVMVMMENRSFDHYFGTFPGVRGFDDRHVRRDGGVPVFEQLGYKPGVGPDPSGRLFPFHLNTRDLTKFAECTDDITHDWGPQHQVWNNGQMNRWVSTHLAVDGDTIGPLSMGYYTRPDLAFYYSLAEAFTLCDGYHCSVIGPTDPNRLYWFSATLDPEGKNGGPILETLVSNRVSEYGKLSWKTMPEALQEAGVTWRVYQDASSDTLLNPLPYFKQFLNDPVLAPNALPGYSYPGTFQADVLSGKLPQVSWIFPSLLACEHPSAPPALGEQFVFTVLKTLLLNQAVWEKTALFVMYDENGGFFDHVPPPTAPTGTTGEYVSVDPLPADASGVRGPIGLGFRVPMFVISPYARGGLVCSDTFDHTSQLRFLETRFGVDVPNLTTWRRHAVGDMTSAFNFAHPAVTAAPLLKETFAQDTVLVGAQCTPGGVTGLEDAGNTYPVPPNTVPHQEPGRRGASPASFAGGCNPKSVLPVLSHSGGPSSNAKGSNQLATTGGDSGLATVGLLAILAGLWRLFVRRRQLEDDELVG